MNRISRTALAAALPAVLLAGAVHAQDQDQGATQAADGAQAGPGNPGRGDGEPVNARAPLIVTGQKREDWRPKLDHIMPEVAGTQITVTKKASAIKLDQIGPIELNNQQQLFARAPGVLISQQQTPSQFNISYRGIGNPQESEYVLVLQDGVPISTDWIGFPTLYYVPLPQSISEVQVIRGGSSLIYGPEPAPAINFVSRRPEPGSPLSAGTEVVGGSIGSYSTYNFVQGTSGALEYRADLGYVRDGGQRDNGASKLIQGDLFLGWRPQASQLFYLDLKGYRLSAGNPGKETIAQFDADPNFSPTPYNHDWVDRISATLGYTADLTDRLRVEAKGWAAYQQLVNRAAPALPPSGVLPASTTIQNTVYKSEGVDLRLRQRWGRGNAFTVGAVAYHDNSPFRQWINSDIYAGRSEHGAPKDLMARSTDYQAVFAENVFRFGQFHLVPSVRLDHEVIDINESFTTATTRPPYDVHDSRTIPSFGLGFGNDFGHGNETYFSVSSGWRPLRYYDVASPFGALQPGFDGDPPRSVDWEAGVHGTPIKGLWYDAGLFWMDFRNRIESQAVAGSTIPGASVNLNTGNTRHRGFEGELSYDFLASRDGASHLIAFTNLQLLDAKFTETHLAGVSVGNRPAFAPKVIAKGGLTWREDKKYDLSLTAVSVSSQYFQDSNQPASVAGVVTVPAKVPRYTVFDLSGDVYVTPNVRILGGVYNLGDERYYSRVFQNGIEPAPGRTFFLGVGLGF